MFNIGVDASLSEVNKNEFKEFAEIIYNISGIVLNDSKMTLLSNRLRPRLKVCHFDSFSQYLAYIKSGEDKAEIDKMIDSVTTNETYFFRSDKHFEALQKIIIPSLLDKHSAPLRIWCAGCSSGEEPYTIAMILNEMNLLDKYKVEIIASDIDNEILNEALTGVYDIKRLRVTPQYYFDKYFSRCIDGRYKLDDKIINFVKFNKINLNIDKFDKRFDVIFCRNVMIYFDRKTQTKIVQKFYDSLNDGGYFFIGHSESLYFIENKFVYEKIMEAPIYCKK